MNRWGENLRAMGMVVLICTVLLFPSIGFPLVHHHHQNDSSGGEKCSLCIVASLSIPTPPVQEHWDSDRDSSGNVDPPEATPVPPCSPIVRHGSRAPPSA